MLLAELVREGLKTICSCTVHEIDARSPRSSRPCPPPYTPPPCRRAAPGAATVECVFYLLTTRLHQKTPSDDEKGVDIILQHRPHCREAQRCDVATLRPPLGRQPRAKPPSTRVPRARLADLLAPPVFRTPDRAASSRTSA